MVHIVNGIQMNVQSGLMVKYAAAMAVVKPKTTTTTVTVSTDGAD